MWTPYPSCKRLCRKIFNADGIVEKQEKAFFFEKKKQKTFISSGVLEKNPRQRSKVFWFFFSKKNIFHLSTGTQGRCRPAKKFFPGNFLSCH
jgi:hypothetical protein